MVKICGDYKVTINPYLYVDQHPLPKPEELFATLSGGQQFSKMDLDQAYLQLELDEESKNLVTISTPKGLYRVYSPAIWSCICPCNFPEANGVCAVGHTLGIVLY